MKSCGYSEKTIRSERFQTGLRVVDLPPKLAAHGCGTALHGAVFYASQIVLGHLPRFQRHSRMLTPLPSQRQFSLRALLWLTLFVAVSLASWRAFGGMALWGLPAAALLAAAAAGPCRSWKRAWLFSGLAVYGPFAAMGVYTLQFVSCSHCKATVWTMFPSAPGILPVDLVRRWLDVPRPSDEIWFAAGMAFSALLLTAVAWLVRRRSRLLRACSIAATLVYGALAAVVILAVIRA